ncbi:PBECR2 nuclease fold domain-containing protein [Caldimonas sp. KR1-144]|uniref:PBECR2 nuclease fold domain-containing protein n=1 Tax=Caldimonas sp. KR1-144 TaxID=3400911 RepID=UPI003C0D2E43
MPDAAAAYGSLPFREQSEFFRRKLNLPTAAWTDVYTREHDWAFVVAGATRDAIVADFRGAIERAIADGTTLEEFRRDFDRIVATHGWDYRGGREWRSRVIYETNLTTSYAAGRNEQLRNGPRTPFWQYVHADWVEHPRAQHVAWDGLVLDASDPWWEQHFPPNGWGCQCSVRGLSLRDLEQLGKSGPDQAPEVTMVEHTIGQRSPNGPRKVRVPEGIDPGFEYTPGASRLNSSIPPQRPEPPLPGNQGGPGLPNLRAPGPMPPPRPFPASELLPGGLRDRDYAGEFLQAFGATLEQPRVFTDAIGERLVIGRALFEDGAGELQADRGGRGRTLPLVAQALLDPDEIWARVEWDYDSSKAVVRRRYLAQFDVGQASPAVVVVEFGQDGWAGLTSLTDNTGVADDWRVGVRLFRRPQEDDQ